MRIFPSCPQLELIIRKLVLNLEGTIIHYSTSELPRYDFTVELEGLQGRHTCHVLKRPGLEQILSKLPRLGYEIVIFTSAKKGFENAMLEKLDNLIPLTHRFYRKHCKKLQYSVLIKDISMLGRDLSQLILVDDKPNFSYQSDNAFSISEFNGDTNDRALYEVMGFCKRLPKSIAPSDQDVRKEILSYTRMLSSVNRHEQMLPPMEKSDRKMSKKTLIHITHKPSQRHDFALEFFPPDGSFTYHVLKRLGVDKLLDELRSIYEILVFTASSKDYADPILNKLDPHGNKIRHKLYKDSCTQLPGPKHVMDLSRLGMSLSNVIFENAYPMRKFRDDMNDRELLSVLEFCKRIANSRSDAISHILSHVTSRHNDCPGWNCNL